MTRWISSRWFLAWNVIAVLVAAIIAIYLYSVLTRFAASAFSNVLEYLVFAMIVVFPIHMVAFLASKRDVPRSSFLIMLVFMLLEFFAWVLSMLMAFMMPS